MSRPLDPAIDALLDDKYVLPVAMCFMDFDTAPLYVHTDLGVINTTTPNATWLGVGDLGTIGVVEDSEGLSPYSLTLGLSGLNADLLDEALEETRNYQGRDCGLYLTFRDTLSGEIVVDPFELFYGFMNVMTVADNLDGSAEIELVVESELAIFDRAANEYWSDNNQQTRFPGDLAMEFLTKLAAGFTVAWASEQNLSLGTDSSGSIDDLVGRGGGAPGAGTNFF